MYRSSSISQNPGKRSPLRAMSAISTAQTIAVKAMICLFLVCPYFTCNAPACQVLRQVRLALSLLSHLSSSVRSSRYPPDHFVCCFLRCAPFRLLLAGHAPCHGFCSTRRLETPFVYKRMLHSPSLIVPLRSHLRGAQVALILSAWSWLYPLLIFMCSPAQLLSAMSALPAQTTLMTSSCVRRCQHCAPIMHAFLCSRQTMALAQHPSIVPPSCGFNGERGYENSILT